MWGNDNSILIMVQLMIELGLLLFFFIMVRNLKSLNHRGSFEKTIKTYESLLKDAKRISLSFHEQLKEKQRLINQINKELDRKISILNGILMELSPSKKVDKSGISKVSHSKQEIIKLNQMGYKPHEIAHKLSITKEEVKLVLDLDSKMKSSV
jgi:hypothetical protein